MALSSDLAALPKAELHIHLEGAVRPATLEEFSARAGLTVPRFFDSLETFVEAFSIAWQAMASPGDYGRMMREYCEDAARAGVRYAEVSRSIPTIQAFSRVTWWGSTRLRDACWTWTAQAMRDSRGMLSMARSHPRS